MTVDLTYPTLTVDGVASNLTIFVAKYWSRYYFEDCVFYEMIFNVTLRNDSKVWEEAVAFEGSLLR